MLTFNRHFVVLGPVSLAVVGIIKKSYRYYTSYKQMKFSGSRNPF